MTTESFPERPDLPSLDIAQPSLYDCDSCGFEIWTESARISRGERILCHGCLWREHHKKVLDELCGEHVTVFLEVGSVIVRVEGALTWVSGHSDTYAVSTITDRLRQLAASIRFTLKDVKKIDTLYRSITLKNGTS